MTGHEAARVLRGLDDVRQRLARVARDAHAFGNVFDAHPPGAPGRELFARLVRALAEEVADALEAVNEMADELAEPRQDG